MSNVKRPKRTSMEGMIWNANHVLEQALRPGIRGIPREFFLSAAGICIMSIVDVGCIFSGAVGTGIMMARYSDGTWSNPVACGLSGVGFGIVIGVAAKDLIIFLPDKNAVKTFFKSGCKLSGKTDVTLGLGREFDGGFVASKGGFTDTLTFGFTKGVFGSISLEGAVIAPRKAVNMYFYGERFNTSDIIEYDKATFPTEKVTLWPDVLAKLELLAKGLKAGEEEEEKVEASAAEDEERVEAARVAADEAAEEIAEQEEVVEVNAEEEAAKEAAGETSAAGETTTTSADAGETTPEPETKTKDVAAEAPKES